MKDQKKNPLQRLIDCGQSCWLDNLTRKMIDSGELIRRTREQGVRGVTSNPNIFNEAISNSDDYDSLIKELSVKRATPEEIYEVLTIRDVQDACDQLRPIYETSHGTDGFVSLEVSPWLAHDADGTMEETRRLFEKLQRPNAFIKIPGSPACVPAIEQMIYEGININITLLFSVESYEAVADAYIKALHRRRREDRPLDRVHSVASFFLSRIDVLVDQLLKHRTGSRSRPTAEAAAALMGKVAVANAKLAYKRFKEIFSGKEWEALAQAGARLQRPLWASTSTKNPSYSDVLYVEPLIGPHTVNTMPEKTLDAFQDHGMITESSVEEDLDQARDTLKNVEKVGINFHCVTWQLLNEGVQKFIDPYDALMATLKSKQESFTAR